MTHGQFQQSCVESEVEARVVALEVPEVVVGVDGDGGDGRPRLAVSRRQVVLRQDNLQHAKEEKKILVLVHLVYSQLRLNGTVVRTGAIFSCVCVRLPNQRWYRQGHTVGDDTSGG